MLFCFYFFPKPLFRSSVIRPLLKFIWLLRIREKVSCLHDFLETNPRRFLGFLRVLSWLRFSSLCRWRYFVLLLLPSLNWVPDGSRLIIRFIRDTEVTEDCCRDPPVVTSRKVEFVLLCFRVSVFHWTGSLSSIFYMLLRVVNRSLFSIRSPFLDSPHNLFCSLVILRVKDDGSRLRGTFGVEHQTQVTLGESTRAEGRSGVRTEGSK